MEIQSNISVKPFFNVISYMTSLLKLKKKKIIKRTKLLKVQGFGWELNWFLVGVPAHGDGNCHDLFIKKWLILTGC